MAAARSKKSNLHLILGSDEGRVKEVSAALAKELAPADDEFALEIVSGQADNSDHASQIVGSTLEALQTLPFFGGEKVVWLQGANFFGDSVTGRSQTTLSAVEGLQSLLESGLPPDVTFILSATEIDKRRSFFKKISKIAEMEVFDKVDISKEGWHTSLIGPVNEWAGEVGVTFEPDAVERFILLVGADTRQIRNELEKLSLFLGGRIATVEDVRNIAAATHTGVIFEISNALADRDLPLTIELIERQLKNGENPVGLLLAAIVPKVRYLLQARDLIERHGLPVGRNYRAFEGAINRLPASEVAHLPRKKDGNPNVYPIFLAANECRKFTALELKEALEACLEANLRLVTTALEPRLVLGQLVTRILSRSSSRKKRTA